MFSKRKLLSVLVLLFLIVLPLAVILPSILSPSPLVPPAAIPSSSVPQLVNAKSPDFDPTWWNTTFRYRTEVNFTETSGITRTNNLVDVYLTFDSGTCYNNTIVVPQYRYNTSGPWMTGPIPCQVWNLTYYPSTSYLASATVTFYVNVTASNTATYYVYYNDSATSWMPTFPSTVSYALIGSNYVFDTVNYQANCSTTRLGGKLYNSYNKISGTWWTSQPATSNGFHWNPDYPNYDSTSRYPPVAYGILSNGSLFVMYNSLARLGGTISAYTNITYRFFEWGWICETNSTFNQSYGAALYRNNEWVFNDKIMPGAAYKSSTGTVYSYTTFSEWWNRDIGRAIWHCFFDTSDKEAMGTVDLIDPTYAGITTSGWSYRLWQPSSTYYQYWDRAWPSTSVTVGGYIYERFANYMWDGSAGYGVFQTFAEMMEKDHVLSISVNSVQERVFFDLNISVMDVFNNPVGENVTVTIYNSAWSGVNDSKSVDSQGNCSFQLYEKGDGYWIEANLTTPYMNYTWRVASVWIPGTNSSSYNINMNVTKLYIQVKDISGTYVQKAIISVNYTDSSLSSYNISNQAVDPFYADLALYVYTDTETPNVNITINTNYGTVIARNFTLLNYNTSVEEPWLQDGLGRIVTLNSSKFFIAKLNESITITPTYLTCETGNIYTKYWNESLAFVVWINWTGGGVDADWMRYTIKNSAGEVLQGPIDMTPDSPTGKWNAIIDTSTLFGDQNYIILIEAAPSDPNNYGYPQPLSLFLDLNNLPLAIIPIPFEWQISKMYSESFTIQALLYDTYNLQPVPDAVLNFTISQFSPADLTGYMNYTTGGIYQISYAVLSQLGTKNYTVTINLSWANHTASSLILSLEIRAVPTVLETALRFEVNWGNNLTIYAVFNQTSPEASIADATLIWSIRGTPFVGVMTYAGDGNYTAQINSTIVDIGSYTLQISASKPNYILQEQSTVLTINGAQTSLDGILTLPLPSQNFIYFGPYIQVENSLPLTPVFFYYHTPGPHSPLSGANVSLTFGPLTFYLVEILPGLYVTFIPTFNLPSGNFIGSISASLTGYQTQQNLVFLSVADASIFFPGFNARVPIKIFLMVFSAIALPSLTFVSYVYIKRARIPYIIKRIDELINQISRGEKVEVKLVPREIVLNDVLREELAILGLEPKVERYIPTELAERVVPLLVESKMKPDEAYALAVELKTATPKDREKLLESVGVSGEISASILKIIEEEEERREIFKKPSQPQPKKAKLKKPEPELEELEKTEFEQTEIETPEKVEEPKEPEEAKLEPSEEPEKTEFEQTEIKATEEVEELEKPEPQKTEEPEAKDEDLEEASGEEEDVELEEESEEEKSG